MKLGDLLIRYDDSVGNACGLFALACLRAVVPPLVKANVPARGFAIPVACSLTAAGWCGGRAATYRRRSVAARLTCDSTDELWPLMRAVDRRHKYIGRIASESLVAMLPPHTRSAADWVSLSERAWMLRKLLRSAQWDAFPDLPPIKCAAGNPADNCGRRDRDSREQDRQVGDSSGSAGDGVGCFACDSGAGRAAEMKPSSCARSMGQAIRQSCFAKPTVHHRIRQTSFFGPVESALAAGISAMSGRGGSNDG